MEKTNRFQGQSRRVKTYSNGHTTVDELIVRMVNELHRLKQASFMGDSNEVKFTFDWTLPKASIGHPDMKFSAVFYGEKDE